LSIEKNKIFSTNFPEQATKNGSCPNPIGQLPENNGITWTEACLDRQNSPEPYCPYGPELFYTFYFLR
jgi:hypothetical protein